MSVDVSRQAPPKVVMGPLRCHFRRQATYLARPRRRARGRREGGRRTRSRSRGGACAESPGSFICICHCRLRWSRGRMPLFSEEDSPTLPRPPSCRLLLSFRVFLRVSLLLSPASLSLARRPRCCHRRRRHRRRRHRIAKNSRIPIGSRHASLLSAC